MHTEPSVPLDIIEMITDQIQDDATSLAACALTCRTWATTSRRHLFRVVALDSRSRAISLGNILASSRELVYMVRTVHLLGQWNTPTIGELLAPLPRLDNADTLELSMSPLDQSSQIGCLLIMEKLPSVRSLHVRDSLLDLHSLASIAASLVSLTALVVQLPYLMQYGLPQERAIPPISMPSNLLSLEVHFGGFGGYGHYPFEQAQTLSRWLFAHLAPNAIRSLTLTSGSNDPTPFVGEMLSEWASMGLQHLALTLSAAGGECMRSSHLLHGAEPSPAQQETTLRSLAACTRLQTFKLHCIEHRSPGPSGSIQPPKLLSVIDVLNNLHSTALRSIILSISWARPLGEPRSSTCVAQFAQLCSRCWVRIQSVLLQPRFVRLQRLTIVGDGSTSALQSFLKSRCPALFERDLIELVLVPPSSGKNPHTRNHAADMPLLVFT